MALKLVTTPQTTPIDKAFVKDKLRVDFDDDDVMIEAFIAAATEYFDGPEGFLKRALIDQTWDLFLDAFPTDSGAIEIPLSPLIEVEGIFHLDSAGLEDEFDASAYQVDGASEPARISLLNGGSWPTAGELLNAVRIRFRAGYLDTTESPAVENVPDAIKLAILLRVKADYDGGDAAEKLRETADGMVRFKYRLHTAMA